MLVLDASLLLQALLPDEEPIDLPGLFEPHDDILAPWLLWAEFRNALITLERRGRLTGAEVGHLITEVDSLGIVLDQMPRSGAVLRLARKQRLSVYDALYLELALHHEADLGTLDRDLASAARAEGVRLAV